MKKEENKMEKIVSLAKRRGFVYPGSEIYGGLANTYDYGPLGVELKNNIKRAWWKYFIQDREDMVGIDGGIISSAKIWEASGHIKNFRDAMVECKECHFRFRPDKEIPGFITEFMMGSGEIGDNPVKHEITAHVDLLNKFKCPKCNVKGNFTKPKTFSGLFKTILGPVEEDGEVAYLRPETAQNIFVNFKNVLNSNNKKIPFGIGQIGKAFRNEITTGNFIFRTLEFEQMEIEYFIAPDANWNKIFESWVDYMHGFGDLIGLNHKHFKDDDIKKDELAFYSKRTIDMEYKFPFSDDYEELWAIAYRTDYDLTQHQKASNQSMEYFDDIEKKKYIPHVIEPTFGVDRTLLALLSEAYHEEGEGDEMRVVLKLKPNMAPYKIAVAPLLGNKEKLADKAREIFVGLKKKWNCVWDDRGNIGKRYRSQDEIGTPYFIVVDFDSLEDDAVTVRDRDTTKQERVKIKDLDKYFEEKLN